MNLLILIFIFSCIFFQFIMVISLEDKYKHLIRLAVDAQKIYRLRSITLVTGNTFKNFQKQFIAVSVMKHFSEYHVFSTIIEINKLGETINYWDKNNVIQPLNIIFLQTSADFESFINFTRAMPINSFPSLVVIDTKNNTIMDICRNPQENIFNVPFNAEMLVYCKHQNILIREWYSVLPNKTKVMDYATWNPKDGLVKLSNDSLYKRRSSLEGLKLRVTGVKERHGNIDGFFGKVLRIIAAFGNFTIDLQPGEESNGIYNSQTKKGTGIVEKLMNKQTDIALQFTQSKGRMQVVDYSAPVMISSTSFFIKKPRYNILQWSIYYKALGERSMICFLCTSLLACFLIAMIILINKLKNGHSKQIKYLLKNIYDSIWSIWGILCRMPLTNFTDSSPMRITYFSLYLLSVMIFSLYTAVLTSYLAKLKTNVPFDTVHDFIEDSTYKLAILADSSIMEQFQDFSNDLESSHRIDDTKHFTQFQSEEIVKKLKPLLITEKDLPKNIASAISQICNNDKLALYTDDYAYQSTLYYSPCEIIAFSKGVKINLGYAFPKKSPYVGFFNYYIHKLQIDGITRVLKQRHMKLVERSSYSYDEITFHSVVYLLIVLFIGLILSILILCFEKIYFYTVKRKLANKKTKGKVNFYFIKRKLVNRNKIHSFTALYTKYWTPTSRSAKKTNKPYFDFVN